MTEPYDGTADAAHINQQVSWLSQWMSKTMMSLTPVIGVGDFHQYGGAPLTEGPFVSVSEQLATLVTSQRTFDDAVSGWLAGQGLEASPGVATLNGFEPGDHPIPPE